MLSNIALGRFFPGNSLVHRLDPRVKIVLVVVLLVTVFLANNYLALLTILAAIFVFMAFAKVSFKNYFKNMKVILFIVVFTSVLNIFYAKGPLLFQIGPVAITKGGFDNSVFVSCRLVMLILISSLLTFTTSPTDLTDALERILKPLSVFKIKTHELAMMMAIALRFIPTLLEETDKIIDAQKARGADMESGNALKRIKALVPILVPLLAASFRRAFDLALAMECRCYNGGDGRTKMKVLHICSNDVLAIFAVVAVFLLVLWSNFWALAVHL